MCNENKVKLFDEFYVENYKYLLGFSKSINPKADYESLTHDVYLRARTRIEENGYSGETFMNFIRVALMNLYKSQYRNEKNKIIIDIDDEDYYQCIEESLSIKEEQEEQEREKQHQTEYITAMIYEYLDKYYSQKDIFVFKTYYQLRHRYLNYKQLAIACDMSITSVSNKIKTIKKDLKRNLVSYIYGGIKMDELLLQVEKLLEKNVSQYFQEYDMMHRKIFGSDWKGCRCKSSKLHDKLKEWYINNKK
jgi:RNA polymerase sigma factor (sigma-70 family)